MLASVRIGTAGWSYPHWKGVIYPKGFVSGNHPLDFHTSHFSSIEINRSFYQSLKPELVKLWIKRVEANPEFRFTAKLHQQFTHFRRIEESAVKEFKVGVRPLAEAGKLGALLIQFPWAFRFTAENQDYLIRLRREFREFPLVAEMRHSSWLAEEAQGTFLDYKIGFCNIDQPVHTSAMPPTSLLTSPVGYVRLHGRCEQSPFGMDSLGTQASNLRNNNQNDYLYSESEMTELAQRIERDSRFSEITFVVFNNDVGGKSVVNALQLQALLTGKRPPVPKELRRRFPVELENFGSNRFEQQSLFTAA